MNDLDKMSLMAKNNQDIRMSGAIVETKTVPQGGIISIGVDTKTLHDISLNPDKYYVALYVISKEQFNSY